MQGAGDQRASAGVDLSTLLTWLADRVLAPLVIALIFSWIVAMIIERHRARREFLTKEVDAVRSALSEIWAQGSSYWGHDSVENQFAVEERILFLEQEIRSGVTDLGEYFGQEFRKEAVSLCADLSTAISGGAFGSPDRKPDEARLKAVRLAAVNLRSALHTARRRNLKQVFRISRS